MAHPAHAFGMQVRIHLRHLLMYSHSSVPLCLRGEPFTAVTFAPMQLENYASGQWIAGSGKQSDLIDAITGELIGTTSSGGLDFGQ